MFIIGYLFECILFLDKSSAFIYLQKQNPLLTLSYEKGV